jgi:LysR family nitrogen assimilation transcriptional regulator
MLLEDLAAFVEVARCGSFAKAANELCIAQSALSKRVQRLEQRVGRQLFERRSKGVELATHAKDFLQRAQKLIADMEEMERNLSIGTETPSGVCRVALPPRIGGVLAPPLIARCEEEMPLVKLLVMEGPSADVHGWLMRGEADIGLTYNSQVGVGFESMPLLVEPLYLLVDAQKAKECFNGEIPRRCTTSALAKVPLIMPRRPSVLRVLVDQSCLRHGLRATIRYEIDGVSTLRGLVEHGMGATIFCLSSPWTDGVKSGRILAIPFTSPLMNWKLHLIHPHTENLAIMRVSQLISDQMDTLLEAGALAGAKRLRGAKGTTE